jgi:hypothetical protein
VLPHLLDRSLLHVQTERQGDRDLRLAPDRSLAHPEYDAVILVQRMEDRQDCLSSTATRYAQRAA